MKDSADEVIDELLAKNLTFLGGMIQSLNMNVFPLESRR